MIKRIFTFILGVIMLFCFASCAQEKEAYTEKLISALKEQEETTVKDIFSFEFDRAYVFNYEDGYRDGDSFAKEYNLNISISQVEAGGTDTIQRIVFVDKSGEFVYLFKCNIGQIYIESDGVVIYPETVIERKTLQEDRLRITFKSSERYGS